jgi:homogentisate 1,2-dioxygenase
MLDRMACGELPPKHHVALRDAAGRLMYEECLTRVGFEGPYTILYHQRRPHEQQRASSAHGWETPHAVAPRELAKRHYKTFELASSSLSPVDARVPLLFNDDVVVSVVRPSAEDSVYFSNGDADDLYFIFKGSGVVRSVFGALPFIENDYVFIPRGTVYRMIPDAGADQYWLSIECLGGMHLLEQWRNEVGQLRMDAPYCHRDFRRVSFEGPRDEGIRSLVVKRGGVFHGFALLSSPLDVVGWDGTVYPWVFPILNFQPRVGLVHLPPTWHGTFGARGALICSFVPRPLDFHEDAVPCPYPHSSVDVDEVLFYCRGTFTSRKGIAPGSISHHPAGIPHGPHPGSYEASVGTRETNELAVMLDCAKPLSATPAALGIEDTDYHDSFVAPS